MAVSIEIDAVETRSASAPLGVAVPLTNADNTGVTTLTWRIAAYPERTSPTDPDASPTNPDFATNFGGWTVGGDGVLTKTETSPFSGVSFVPDLPGKYLITLNDDLGSDTASAVVEVLDAYNDMVAPAAGESDETGTFRGWSRSRNRLIEMAVRRLMWRRVYNGSGGAIAAGKVVRIIGAPDWRGVGGNTTPSGSSTQRQRIQSIEVTDGSESATGTHTHGIVTASINDTEFGWVQCGDIYEGDFSSYSVGDRVYADASGDLTPNPTGVMIGYVLVANATGAMMVQGFANYTVPALLDYEDAATDDILTMRQVTRTSSGTVEDGFGIRELVQLEDENGDTKGAVAFDYAWSDAGGVAKVDVSLYSTTAAGILNLIRLLSEGADVQQVRRQIDGSNDEYGIGFYGLASNEALVGWIGMVASQGEGTVSPDYFLYRASGGGHLFKGETGDDTTLVSIRGQLWAFDPDNDTAYLRMSSGEDAVAQAASGMFRYHGTDNKTQYADNGGAWVDLEHTQYLASTDVGNVGTGEDDLWSYTAPADKLSEDGQCLTAEFFFEFASNTNSKRIRIYWASTLLMDTGSDVFSGGTVSAKVRVIRTGAATQRIIVQAWSDNALLESYVGATVAGTETLSSTVVLKATGEAVSDDDIVNTFANVVHEGAA